MAIVIEAQDAKRVLAPPFNLEGPTEELRALASHILAQLQKNAPSSWVQVPLVQPALGDAKPIPWAQK